MTQTQLSKKQCLAKMYNARSTIESMISMLNEDIILPDSAAVGVLARMNAIFGQTRNSDDNDSEPDNYEPPV